MKGKFRILGLGLGVFSACALMLALIPAAPVAAATAVTSVKVDFPFNDTSPNKTGTNEGNEYLVYFKPTTALVRGIDYVTVTFPDGTATMSGTAGTGYAFTVTSADALDVQFSTDYGTLGYTDATWTKITADGTVGGYRVKVKTPIDIAAGTGVWVKFDPDASDSVITSASTAGVSYKVYVATTKDTTPVLSSAFSLGSDEVDLLVVTPLVTTAGVSTQYIAAFDPSTEVGIGGTVTLKFPLGTTIPTSISTSDVLFSANGTDYSNSTAATVDTDLRTITGTTPIALTPDESTNRYMKILSSAGVANPQTATTTSKCMISTSTDAWWQQEATGRTIAAGSATKIILANGQIGLGTPTYYSDNATMINMLSSYIYVTMADQYGNAKLVTGGVTVSLSSSSGTGTFYVNSNVAPGSGAYSSATSISVTTASPYTAAQQVYYKDTTAGTHTLTFSADTYTSATWTITVASAISLYDASNNLLNTYGASSTSPVAEILAGSGTVGTTQKYGVDYINDAITASMAGDTVKLGDGIYEVDATAISVSKAITLTSVNGASSTTLKPTADSLHAIQVTISGTATNPVIISGLTFDRLRAAYEFDAAVMNDGYDYLTVQNCVFNYVIPDEAGSEQAVIWVRTGSTTITSCTISNNTFSNCVGFNAISDGAGRTGSIQFYDTSGTSSLTGVTVSGNTLTDCNDYGIVIGGGGVHSYAATISNNTITRGYSCIATANHVTSVSITGNTITDGYNYGIFASGDDNTGITIKNNTITGCAATNGAIYIPNETTAGVVTVQYNDITGTNSEGYAIKISNPAHTDSVHGGFDCKYNWFGSATGPNYTALTGAVVTKSNPNGTGDKITDYVTYYPWLHKSRANVVADNASYQACTIKLGSGWNTLSTPVKLISAADSVDELIPSGMTIGYYYDSGWQQITTGYVLNPCNAVYLKMSAEKYVLFKFDASAFSTPSKALAAGWNLIGLAALDSDGMHADDAVASVAKTAANLPGYSQVISSSINATQTDMYYNTGTNWVVSYGQSTVTDMMFAGLGYWVYMQNAATLAGFEITPIAPDLD